MPATRRQVLKAVAAGALAGAAGHSQKKEASDWLGMVRSHLGKIIDKGTDVYGPIKTPMWMASLDTRTGTYPEHQPKALVGQRVYRDIAAPRGSTIYWDQPELVAAHALSQLTGEPRFSTAADAYVRSFLERCVDENGLFEWGNHRYYDAYTDKVVRFQGGPHEMRPIPGAWELFWRISPGVTERQIRQAAKRHVFDERTGGFNRHDDGKPNCAFLESGGILVESLCWLARKTADRALVDRALRIARYSFDNRNRATGLVENNPTVTRWDKYVSTTEVGLWGGSLLRAADLTGVEEFVAMARKAVGAWLRYGYDKKTRQYYGQLNVKDGTPVLATKAITGPNEYYPSNYSDIWNAMFPTHDYPMAMAETCLQLYRRTKEAVFEQAVHRWVGVIKGRSAPQTAKDGRGAYAELFGRLIHFLNGSAQLLSSREHLALARQLANEAQEMLFAHGMFRSHAGEDRYDAVDGVGFLLLALIYLQTGKQADYMGFGF